MQGEGKQQASSKSGKQAAAPCDDKENPDSQAGDAASDGVPDCEVRALTSCTPACIWLHAGGLTAIVLVTSCRHREAWR